MGEIKEEPLPQGLHQKFQACPGNGMVPTSPGAHPVDDPWVAFSDRLQEGFFLLNPPPRFHVWQQVIGDEKAQESQHRVEEARWVVADGALPDEDVGNPAIDEIFFAGLECGKNFLQI